MDTRLEIQKLSTLPPLSIAVHELIAAVDNSDLDVRSIAAIIEKDPALLARIIGLANSAYFGYPERVTTAEDAIFHVLGLNTARSLALSMVLSGPFRTAHCPDFEVDRFWLTAIMTATLTERMARLVTVEPRPLAGNGYLAGLLHHLGILAMVHLYPREMGDIFSCHRQDGSMALETLEHNALGATHCEVGGWLGRKWRLPSFTITVMEHHRDTDYQGDYQSLVRLVGFSSMWANGLFTSMNNADMGWLQALGIAAGDAENILGDMIERRDELAAMARFLGKE